MRNIIEHISNKQVGLVYTKRPPLRLQSTQCNEYFYQIAFFYTSEMIRSSYFFVFGHFDVEVMKIQKYYVIFVHILQGKMCKTEKNGTKITQLK